jgi:ribonuclease P protein component
MAQARRSSDRFFTVLARSNHLPCARLGLAVSRKAARRAVDRNLIKRLAREAFRQSAPQASVDVIVFARQAAVRQSRGELRSSLNGHFRRLLADRVT